MKLFYLMEAHIKSFLRNWKNLIFLIILPFILISLVFLSFSPNGLQKIKAGFIISSNDFANFVSFFNYLDIKYYDELDKCINELKQHEEYVCVEIKNYGNYYVNIFYDNTREPVIWEIVERIKGTFDFIKAEISKKKDWNIY
ncbi:MAG: hypothetical protein QXZ43_02295 [Candidatus Aenigmatarchaeota archaeon]